MIVIANNLSYRTKGVVDALKHRRADFLQDLARRCAAAGANYLEIDIGPGHHNDKEVLEFAVRAVQEAVDLPLVLSAGSAETMEAGINAAKRSPVLNYVSAEAERLEKFLPLAAYYNTDVVLLTVDWRVHVDVQDSLALASVLVGAANAEGIPNERIWVDPALIHLRTTVGQQHVAAIPDFLRAVKEIFEPAVKTTCWLSNVSAGSPHAVRSTLDAYYLTMLAGAGLQSAFVDVLDREVMRAVRLVNAFSNETIYADALAELRSPSSIGMVTSWEAGSEEEQYLA